VCAGATLWARLVGGTLRMGTGGLTGTDALGGTKWLKGKRGLKGTEGLAGDADRGSLSGSRRRAYGAKAPLWGFRAHS
jgi:hypothetical protein